MDMKNKAVKKAIIMSWPPTEDTPDWLLSESDLFNAYASKKGFHVVRGWYFGGKKLKSRIKSWKAFMRRQKEMIPIIMFSTKSISRDVARPLLRALATRKAEIHGIADGVVTE